MLEDEDKAKPAAEPPCAVCRQPAPFAVWGKTRLCIPCTADYDVDMGDRLAKLSPAELVALTAQWVAAAKAKKRAA